MSHTHIGIKDQNGVYTVLRDGQLLLCPKLMYPMLKQVQRTPLHPPEMATELARLPCSTVCPFAEITRDDFHSVSYYEISCEGGCKKIRLDEVKPFEKPASTPTLSIAD